MNKVYNIEAVFFDLDDTLFDRYAALIEFATWQARDLLGMDRKSENNYVERFITLDAKGTVWKDKVYESLIQEFGIKNQTVGELLKSYEYDFCNFCRPRKGVLNAIKELSKADKKIGLVSNGKSPFQEKNFMALKLSEYFDVVIVSEAVGLRKPDIRIFELACSRAGVKAEHAVFVGDNPRADIEGAMNAGMLSVYIPAQYGDKCHVADAICNDFIKLSQIIDDIALGLNQP